jgi:hypothetical protein
MIVSLEHRLSMAFLCRKVFAVRMPRAPFYLNPFGLWTDLALQTTSLMLASAEVISHRTTRMAQASIPPNARDMAEFTLMGQEKVEAAIESMQAGTRALMAFSPLNVMKLYTDMAVVQTDLLHLGASSTLPAAIARHTKLGRSVRKATVTAATLSDQTASGALDMLKPVHSRARANARRLRKP